MSEQKTFKITQSQKVALEYLTIEKEKVLKEHESIQAKYNEIDATLQAITAEAVETAGLDVEKVLVTSLNGEEITYTEKSEDSFKN